MPASTAPAVDDPDLSHADPRRVLLPAILAAACLGPGELFLLDPVILASLALITIPQMLPLLNRRVHPCHCGLTTKTTQTIYDLGEPSRQQPWCRGAAGVRLVVEMEGLGK